MPRAINKVPIAPSPQTGRSANSSNKLFGFICVIQNRAAGGHKPGSATDMWRVRLWQGIGNQPVIRCQRIRPIEMLLIPRNQRTADNLGRSRIHRVGPAQKFCGSQYQRLCQQHRVHRMFFGPGRFEHQVRQSFTLHRIAEFARQGAGYFNASECRHLYDDSVGYKMTEKSLLRVQNGSLGSCAAIQTLASTATPLMVFQDGCGLY